MAAREDIASHVGRIAPVVLRRRQQESEGRVGGDPLRCADEADGLQHGDRPRRERGAGRRSATDLGVVRVLGQSVGQEA